MPTKPIIHSHWQSVIDAIKANQPKKPSALVERLGKIEQALKEKK